MKTYIAKVGKISSTNNIKDVILKAANIGMARKLCEECCVTRGEFVMCIYPYGKDTCL